MFSQVYAKNNDTWTYSKFTYQIPYGSKIRNTLKIEYYTRKHKDSTKHKIHRSIDNSSKQASLQTRRTISLNNKNGPSEKPSRI